MTQLTQVEELESQLGDLREVHPQADLTALRARYGHDPVGFMCDVLHGEPWDRQADIAELVRDHPRVAVQSCNGAGKDWLASYLCVWAAAMGWFVVITGTSERQVRATLMDTAFAAWQNATPALPGQFQQMGWLPDRSKKEGILAFVSTDSGRARGHHAPKLMAIITEAQSVEADVYLGIRQCLTGAVTRFLLLGNPDKPEGDFWKACTKSAGWKRVQLSAYDCPNVKAGREIVPGGVDKAYIEQQAADYGDQSPIYRTTVLGQFPEETSVFGLFPRIVREAAYARWEAGSSIARADALGVDVGETVDLSVAAVRGGKRIEELQTWRLRDSMLVAGKVREVAQRWHVRPASDGGIATGTIVVDANAVGKGLHDRLKEERFRVVTFKSQYGAPEQKRKTALEFANMRAAAYWRLHELVAGDLQLPRDPLLDEELAATTYTTNSRGRILIRPKEEIEKRLGRSPDRADAVAMACWEEPTISGLGAAGQW